jgi:hypothetical protein
MISKGDSFLKRVARFFCVANSDNVIRNEVPGPLHDSPESLGRT